METPMETPMVNSSGQVKVQPRYRLNYNAKRKANRALAKLGPPAIEVEVIEVQVKVQPPYRHKLNKAKRDHRALTKLEPETAERKAHRLAYNKRKYDIYQALNAEQRRRKNNPQKKLNIKLRRKFVTASRLALYLKSVVLHMQTDENRAYIENQALRILLCTPKRDMIEYLIGPLCNLEYYSIQQMDSILRIAMFMQFKRLNEVIKAELTALGKRWEKNDHCATVTSFLHGITQSYSSGAIDNALAILARKTARSESGAFSKVAMTTAINQQAYRSCNMTGLQTITDCVNRNEASGEEIMYSRTSIQKCGLQIATGTKTVVQPTISDDYRVYTVDPIDELTNITNLEFLENERQLSTDVVTRYLDHSYEGNPAWRGCVVLVDLSDPSLVKELKANAIDLNMSCDGFEMASSSNGAVGSIITFKGPETLSKINPDYEEQKDNPEFGDRAGEFMF